MTRPPSGIRSCERGATAVEMAITLLAVIVLILGMVEFAVGYWMLHTTLLAVEEIGRYAMVNNATVTTTDAESRVCNLLTGSTSAQASLNISAMAPTTWTGTVNLVGGTLLSFGGGTISAIANGGSVHLLALGGQPQFPALSGLTSNAGTVMLGGITQSFSGTLNNSGTLTLDTAGISSTITLGGLNNTGTVTVKGTFGGSFFGLPPIPPAKETLSVLGSAPSTLTGTYDIGPNAELAFGSGNITSRGIASGCMTCS